MEVNDSRTVADFQKTTFCGHPRAHVRKVLIENIRLGNADYACYWTLELLCSGLVHSIWDAFFEASALAINRSQPNVFLFLAQAYETYAPLEAGYTVHTMTEIRNNPDVRRILCDTAATLALCRKSKLPSLPTIKVSHDFDPVTIQENIKAPSTMFGRIVMRPADPMPANIPINEFCYCIRPDVRDATRALYWMSWVYTYCREHKKQTKSPLLFANRGDEYVLGTHGTHPVWIFWDAVRKQAGPHVKIYVETLYKIHSLRWSPTDKSRQCLLLAAIVLVCESAVDTSPVLGGTVAVSNVLAGMPGWIDAILRMHKSFSSDTHK